MMLYWAYGSNLNPVQMRRRAPTSYLSATTMEGRFAAIDKIFGFK